MKQALSNSSWRFFAITLFLLQIGARAQIATVNLPSSIADAGVQVQPVKTGLGYSEGPLVDANGNLYFAEQNAGIFWKVTPAGISSQWRTNINTPNGMDISTDGYILCCESQRITKVDSNGKVIETVTQNQSYGLINDFSLNSKGAMFFTNNSNALFYRSAAGSVTTFSNYNVNGIEWIEERNCIYLNMGSANRVARYTMKTDGTIDLAARRDIIPSVRGPDGLTVDADYNLYIASYGEGKFFVYDSTGKLLGDITMKQGSSTTGNAANCAFGGPDNKTLYLTGNGGAYKINLKVAGRKRPDLTSAERYSFLPPRRPARPTDMAATCHAIMDLRGRVVSFSGMAGPTRASITGPAAGSSLSTGRYVASFKSGDMVIRACPFVQAK
jgi:gluconolactonase